MWFRSKLFFLLSTFWLLLLVSFSWAVEVRIPVKGLRVYDGDTFFVQMQPELMKLPPGIKIDGVETDVVEVPPVVVMVRLVDNHIRGKTRPANSPELKTPSGRAQRGAVAARDRAKELIEGHEGDLIINTDLMQTKRNPEYNLSRLLTLGRILADFDSYDQKSTVGAIMFREGHVKDWSKK